jgi:hypothetical protein
MRATLLLNVLIASTLSIFQHAEAFSGSVGETGSIEVTRVLGEVDYDSKFAESSFPIKPAALLNRAKEVLGPDVGIGTKDGGECLAEDFEFCAAVVGPIGKEGYLGALDSFQLEDSFDISQNFFGFVVDPLQTNRVHFFSRQTGEFNGKSFLGKESDGTKLTLPPQALHIDFNADGKVKEFGFYTVDRRQGNTGGLGGAFGFMYGIGKPLPIPECAPYKPSFRFRFLNFIGAIGRTLQRNKK